MTHQYRGYRHIGKRYHLRFNEGFFIRQCNPNVSVEETWRCWKRGIFEFYSLDPNCFFFGALKKRNKKISQNCRTAKLQNLRISNTQNLKIYNTSIVVSWPLEYVETFKNNTFSYYSRLCLYYSIFFCFASNMHKTPFSFLYFGNQSKISTLYLVPPSPNTCTYINRTSI